MLLVLGLPIWLAILIAFECVFLITCSAREWPEAAIITFLATLGVVQVLGGVPVVEFLWANPEWVAGGFAIYLVAGTAWSVWMWITDLKKAVNQALDWKTGLYKKYSFGTVSVGEAKATLAARLLETEEKESEERARTERAWNDGPVRHDGPAHHRRSGSNNAYVLQQDLDVLEKILTPPQASDNKRKIMGNIAAWPPSMVWYVIDEPIKQIFEWMKGTYQRISNHMWKSVLDAD